MFIFYLTHLTWHQWVLFYVVMNLEVCEGVCVYECMDMFRCWVGEGGSWVGFDVFLVLSVGWGWDLFGKMPCDLRRPFLLYSLLHSIIGAFGSMVGKIFGLGLCNSYPFSASLLGIMLLPFLPLQVMYFRALPHSLGYIFLILFFSLMILNIMHHVQDCNRVLGVRRGLVVSTVLFPPTSLKYRVIKTLELCSCGREREREREKLRLQYRNLQISAFLMLHPICFFTHPVNWYWLVHIWNGYCVSFPNIYIYTLNGFYRLVFERHAIIWKLAWISHRLILF